MVERSERALKDRIDEYFKATDTKRRVEVLDDLLKNYNTSYQRIIKMTPEEAVKDPHEVTKNTTRSEKDYVQMSKYRKTFLEVIRQTIQLRCLLFLTCTKSIH